MNVAPENHMERLNRGRVELDEHKRSSVPKLVELGDELRRACTSDLEQVGARVNEIVAAVAELESRMDAYNEHVEKERAFAASVSGVKAELSELEARLASSSTSTLSPDDNDVDELRGKIELCKQLVDESSAPATKTETLRELKGLFDRLEKLIESKQQEHIQKQNLELENFKKRNLIIINKINSKEKHKIMICFLFRFEQLGRKTKKLTRANRERTRST